MGRILAVDYGAKRTGLAVTDPLRIIASPLQTVPTHTAAGYIAKYCTENPVDVVVVGKPVQADGSTSESYRGAENLKNRLAKLLPAVKVVWFDERYTSVLAQRAIIESGVAKMKRRDKAMVDMVSAAIILQDYLESRQYKTDGPDKDRL